MADLINRKAANEALEKLSDLLKRRAETKDHGFLAIQAGVTLAQAEIEAVPSVDAAPVVRCKNCRHSSRIANDVAMMRHCWNGRGRNNGDGFSRVKQDGYCDDGERKEGEHGTD